MVLGLSSSSKSMMSVLKFPSRLELLLALGARNSYASRALAEDMALWYLV